MMQSNLRLPWRPNLTVTAGGLSGLTFVASDNALLVAATVEGLLIDNPLNHP